MASSLWSLSAAQSGGRPPCEDEHEAAERLLGKGLSASTQCYAGQPSMRRLTWVAALLGVVGLFGLAPVLVARQPRAQSKEMQHLTSQDEVSEDEIGLVPLDSDGQTMDATAGGVIAANASVPMSASSAAHHHHHHHHSKEGNSSVSNTSHNPATEAPPPMDDDDEPQAPRNNASSGKVTPIDEDSVCYNRYRGGRSRLWKGLCQCQVSGNVGCLDTPCRCPESCSGKVWKHTSSVTYPETVEAFGCGGPSTVLVTIPKSFFRDIHDLKKSCPEGMVGLLTEMLQESYQKYQEQVAPRVVQQCIHSASRTHTHWMTIHTLCGEGQVDHMPSNSDIAWCGTMASPEEAEGLARVMTTWAGGEVEDKKLPDTCAQVGCGNNDPGRECGCDPDCQARGDCCSDYAAVCQAATVMPPECQVDYISGSSKGSDCFCQRAGNGGCVGMQEQCLCNHGCEGPVWQHSASVTFPNVVDAWSCGNGHSGTALLTIPKTYFRNIDHLREMCPQAAGKLLASMLRAGFETYQQQVGPGVVRHCIHSGFAVSVRWLHIHTFCPEGTVDGMPLRNAIAWCGTMSTASDADELAEVILAWATANALRKK